MAQDTNSRAPGRIIQHARERRGITQDQVVANTTIPTKSQLSNYENDRISIARSKHLQSLAEYIGLTDEELRAINPSIQIRSMDAGQAVQVERQRRVAKTTDAVRGDVIIPAAHPGHFNQLTYDKKSASGYLVTEAGGEYWIWSDGRVPTGHKVLGALLGWSIEVLPVQQ